MPSGLEAFIRFPKVLYKNDANYVPQLRLSEVHLLTKNPFLEHSKLALFIAAENKKTVGRIAAIYNRTHLDTYNDRTGFFGLFDAIDDTEVAKTLLKAAEDWLKAQGITKIAGPSNLTTNDSVGVLIKGFETPPSVLMPYNYPYYGKLLSKSGYKKELDLFSYRIDGTSVRNKYDKILKYSDSKLRNNGISFRSPTKASFDADIIKLRKTYNESNADNKFFMPLNEKEFENMAADLKMIVPLDLVIFAEKAGEIIGFIVAVPDMNQILIKIKNGRLLPTGIFKLLFLKKKISDARIMILGVSPTHTGRGIDLILYHKIKSALLNYNISSAEACYVMESNRTMNQILTKIGGTPVKTYRLYGKSI